jgi:3-oxoacyl-[acyl-carrier-protein] synthase III
MNKAAITGIEGYVPDHILSNTDLEKMVDTTNDWIISRTGIKERRILKDSKNVSIIESNNFKRFSTKDLFYLIKNIFTIFLLLFY